MLRLLLLAVLVPACSQLIVPSPRPPSDASFITRNESGAMLALPEGEATDLVTDKLAQRGLAVTEDVVHDGAHVLLFRGILSARRSASIFAVSIENRGHDRTSVAILGRPALTGVDDQPLDPSSWAGDTIVASKHGEVEAIVAVLADLDATGLVLGPPGHTAFCAEQRDAIVRRAQQVADDAARRTALRDAPVCPRRRVVERE